MACRVAERVFDPSRGGSIGDGRKDDGFWTFADVEARLIGAVELWRRSPGGGRSPFAGDAPWELAFRDAPGPGSAYSWDVIKEEAEAAARRRVPLSRAEVAERDAASALILLAPERDRRLVVVTVAAKASGRRVRWSEIRRALGPQGRPGGTGLRGLGMRYSRAVTAIARALNGAL